VCVCVSVVCRALNERVSNNEKVALSCVITANWHGNAAGAWKCKRTGLQWNVPERSAQHANTIRRYDHTFDQNDLFVGWTPKSKGELSAASKTKSHSNVKEITERVILVGSSADHVLFEPILRDHVMIHS
jgi:hypothetical protein